MLLRGSVGRTICSDGNRNWGVQEIDTERLDMVYSSFGVYNYGIPTSPKHPQRIFTLQQVGSRATKQFLATKFSNRREPPDFANCGGICYVELTVLKYLNSARFIMGKLLGLPDGNIYDVSHKQQQRVYLEKTARSVRSNAYNKSPHLGCFPSSRSLIILSGGPVTSERSDAISIRLLGVYPFFFLFDGSSELLRLLSRVFVQSVVTFPTLDHVLPALNRNSLMTPSCIKYKRPSWFVANDV